MNILLHRRGIQHSMKNPYVTDGLLSMFDGEWNAGLGKHDANLNTWVDLAPNNESYDIAFDGSGYSWETKSLHLQKTTALNFRNANFPTKINNDELSIEFIVKPISGSSGFNTTIYFSPSTRRGVAFYGSGDYLLYGVSYRISNDMNKMAVNFGAWDSVTRKMSIYGNSFVVGNNSFSINGTETITSTLFGLNRNKAYEFEIFSLRVYGKVLMQSEIAHNAAVDLARFGV